MWGERVNFGGSFGEGSTWVWGVRGGMGGFGVGEGYLGGGCFGWCTYRMRGGTSVGGWYVWGGGGLNVFVCGGYMGVCVRVLLGRHSF